MTIAQEKFTKLYLWASKYAYVCRSSWVDQDDARQDMALTAITCRHKSDEYVKQAMRNKLIDTIRRRQMAHKYIVPLEPEHENVPDCERIKRLEHTDLVRMLKQRANKRTAIVMNHLMSGYTVAEIERIERMSRRTIYRYISVMRGILQVYAN